MGYSQVRIKSHWLYLALLLSLLAISAHDWLPKKHVFLLNANARVSLYKDSVGSTAVWQDETHRSFRCTFGPQASEYKFCGFNVLAGNGIANGADFSSYSTLRLKLRYDGKAELLRFYFRNFTKGLSSLDDIGSTAKYIRMLIPARDLNGEIELPLNQFTLADWWIRNMSLPTGVAYTEFDNIVHLGVDFPYPVIPGEHTISVEKIELTGAWISRENWYMSILAFWFVLLMLTNLLQYVRYHRMLTVNALELHKVRNQADQLEEQSRHYRALSMLDQLTETLNRRGIERQYQVLHLAQRWPGTATMLLDIDHFKRVNDVYGHEIGDLVLAAIATLIRDELRGHDEIGRWGGEEFILMCPNTNAESARELAEKIRKRIEREHFIPPRRLRVSASIGVTIACEKETFDDTFRRVDQAMYTAKQQGRNRTVYNAPNAEPEDAI